MVRIAYRNNFYEMGWGISDVKKELGTKSKIMAGSNKNEKSVSRSKMGSLRVSSKTKSL